MQARHAGLKTRAPSSHLCTDGVSFLVCQSKSINVDFAKALGGGDGLLLQANRKASSEAGAVFLPLPPESIA